MGRSRSYLVTTIGIGALAVVGAAVLFFPAWKWSQWWYGDRFTFCGHELEGSAIVFVVDRSGSNIVGFSAAKGHMLELIERAAPHFEFGVVFSDNGTYRFPQSTSVLTATRANKHLLKETISMVPGGGGSCIAKNLLVALDMAKDSRAEKKLVIYMGDGGGTCLGISELEYLEGTLAAVAESNQGEVIIHCVNSKPGNPVGTDFQDKLSGATGGTVIALPETD